VGLPLALSVLIALNNTGGGSVRLFCRIQWRGVIPLLAEEARSLRTTTTTASP